MAGRGRADLSGKQGKPGPEPLVYTAQDVARFCEVDLKTIHHWANANKIVHHRTEGRHIRIRRNDLLKFLRAHGYPLHDAITSVKPTIFLAAASSTELASDDLAKRLASRFWVRRFAHAATAIAHLVHDEPDALVCSLDDPSWNAAATIAALRSDPDTAWPVMVAVTKAPPEAGRDVQGADLVVAEGDLSRLPSELARQLAV